MGQVKVDYPDVSIIQVFIIQIPTIELTVDFTEISKQISTMTSY